MDAHVGNFILSECFAGYLKHKTRVLVTHKFESLKYVDYIYMFSKGEIVGEGTLESLKETELFQEIEQKYKMHEKEEEKKEELEIRDTKHPSSLDNNNTVIEPSLRKKEEYIQMSLMPEELTEETAIIQNNEKQGEEVIPEDEKEARQLQEKLMLEEDREIGEVSWSVYKSYFKYYGGWCYFLIIFAGNKTINLHKLFLLTIMIIILIMTKEPKIIILNY